MLSNRAWEQFPSLHGFLCERGDGSKIAKIDNQLVRIHAHEYAKFRVEKINEIVSRFVGSETIVELGCGFGLNLFSLYLKNGDRSYAGFDISDNALAIGEQLKDHFGVSTIDFSTIDLTNPDHEAWGELEGKTVFTYHCLEQMPRLAEGILTRLAKARPKLVTHIEPAVGLYNFFTLRDLASFIYIQRRDYSSNLIAIGDRMEASGVIEVVSKERLYYSPEPRYDSTLLVWRPKN